MTNNAKIALVTGGNQGIGLQIVKDLACHGLTVFAGSRDLERGRSAIADIGHDVRAIQLDVTDQASIDAAAAQIASDFGILDVLVNNAAISNTSMTPEMSVKEYLAKSSASKISLEEMRAIWETNVFGVVAVSQAMLPLLKRASSGRIVNISGGSLTENADPNFPFRAFYTPGYGASKTALNAITLAFSIELAGTSVKVNAVLPGSSPTKINGFMGHDTLGVAAAEVVKVATAGEEVPNGTFTRWENVAIPW